MSTLKSFLIAFAGYMASLVIASITVDVLGLIEIRNYLMWTAVLAIAVILFFVVAAYFKRRSRSYIGFVFVSLVFTVFMVFFLASYIQDSYAARIGTIFVIKDAFPGVILFSVVYYVSGLVVVYISDRITTVSIQPDRVDKQSDPPPDAPDDKLEKAIKRLEKKIENNPADAKLLLDLAKLYYKTTHKTNMEILETIKKAVKIDPDYAESYSVLGSQYDAMNDHANAIKALEKAIKLGDNGTNNSSIFLLCKCCCLAENYKKSIKYGKKYIKENDEEEYVYYWLAFSYYFSDDRTNADEMFNEFLKRTPDYKVKNVEKEIQKRKKEGIFTQT
jgi:cytochrome c-type biogenesis protein CcmH/NrfG